MTITLGDGMYHCYDLCTLVLGLSILHVNKFARGNNGAIYPAELNPKKKPAPYMALNLNLAPYMALSFEKVAYLCDAAPPRLIRCRQSIGLPHLPI